MKDEAPAKYEALVERVAHELRAVVRLLRTILVLLGVAMGMEILELAVRAFGWR